MTLRILRALLAACTLQLLAFSAAAQPPWPVRPITIIHSSTAGGIMDGLARVLAEQLGAALKQPVIVESRSGANGIVSAEYVANAAPDGYTLLLGTNAQLAVNPHLQKMRINTLTDLKPISQVALAQNMLVVRPELPVHSLAEFIAYAKQRPGELTYGSSGNGSLQHIGAELFQQMTGTRFTHVPYKGGAPARMDLLAGHIDLMFGDMGAVPSVNAGKLRALAVTGAARDPLMPSIPTLDELGLKGYAVEGWYLLAAPAKTSDAITSRIADLIAVALKKPETIKNIEGVFMRPAVDASPDFATQELRREYTSYGKLIRDANIKLD